MHILEICANSLQSALHAEAGGAHRIELCQNLEAGGITPSFGLIKSVKDRLQIPVYVLIRPRTGDFVYDDDEFGIMLEDVRMCCQLGCEGIAIGVLTQDGCVDEARLTQLVECAKPMAVTFHRAFDDCRDMDQAVKDIINAGCVRILTSGGANTAVEGASTLRMLAEKAKHRIVIMPGAGITPLNLEQLAHQIGANEYHASAKKSIDAAIQSRFQCSQWQTDQSQVESLVAIIDKLDVVQQHQTAGSASTSNS